MDDGRQASSIDYIDWTADVYQTTCVTAYTDVQMDANLFTY